MKILIVRLRLIGDVVLTTPILRTLRERYPDAHLTYVVERGAAGVIDANPHLSHVITLVHRRGWARLEEDVTLAWRLRRMGFDAALDLHGGPRSAWLTWASGARRRVGYDVQGRTWMYTDIVSRPRTLRGGHSVENQWAVLAAFDPAVPATPDRTRNRVEMPVTDAARLGIDRRLAALDAGPHPRWVVVHVGAGNQFRQWSAARFAEVAATLVAHATNRRVVVVGGPGDSDAVRQVVAAARAQAGAASNHVSSLEGLSLAELRALMDRAALFIGCDSGPLHIAATSDVPIVGIYGPTLPATWGAWRPEHLPTRTVDVGDLPCRPCDQRVCAPGDYRCLTQLPAVRVSDAAEALLEASR